MQVGLAAPERVRAQVPEGSNWVRVESGRLITRNLIHLFHNNYLDAASENSGIDRPRGNNAKLNTTKL
jgi:hypothetical protein